MSATPKKPRFADLILGPLPVDVINRTLGHDLDDGEVVFTGGAQAHAMKRHAEEFVRCLPHVGSIVCNPDFMGDDFHNPGKIELIGRVPALDGGVLVAVIVEPDESGRYRIASCYRVSAKKIENRRQKGLLRPPRRN